MFFSVVLFDCRNYIFLQQIGKGKKTSGGFPKPKLTKEIAKKEHEDLYAERGSQYIKLWRYFDALEDFKKAIYLDPINLRAIKKIAAVYFVLGDDEKSLKYYNDMMMLLDILKESVKDDEMRKEMEKDAEFAKNKIGVLERIIAKRKKEKDLTASYLRKQGNLRAEVENGKGVMLCPDGVPVSIKKATCNGKETEYLLYRNNFGEWDLPFMNCPIR